LNIVDTHAHLDMSHFDKDREDVIARAKDAGVKRIVTIGIDLKSNLKAIQLAEKYPEVQAAVGIHPQESTGIQKKHIDQLAQMSKHSRVVGIGETGLDYFHNNAPREDQLHAFEWQLELAQTRGLPVIIHSRQALEETRVILRNWSSAYKLPVAKPRGVIHCFGGDLATALEYIEMGFYISIGGYIGYPSSAPLREAVAGIPVDKLVIETDCPFLPPQKFRGKRNEPAYTAITAGILAEIKHMPLEDLASRTTQNAEILFNLTH
jgi:TatD DNase family protein